MFNFCDIGLSARKTRYPCQYWLLGIDKENSVLGEISLSILVIRWFFLAVSFSFYVCCVQ